MPAKVAGPGGEVERRQDSQVSDSAVWIAIFAIFGLAWASAHTLNSGCTEDLMNKRGFSEDQAWEACECWDPGCEPLYTAAPR